MSYFIFGKNLENINGSIYRIAENQSDLNSLNIFFSDYKIIEDSQENFNDVKYGKKFASKYSNNLIILEDISTKFNNKIELQNYVNNFKTCIKIFKNSNINHPLYSRWNNYLNQLDNLNLDNITYPLDKSLEEYFNDQGQPSYNILQIP